MSVAEAAEKLFAVFLITRYIDVGPTLALEDVSRELSSKGYYSLFRRSQVE